MVQPVFCTVDTGSFVLLISKTITHLLESETKLALGDALTALALGLLHPVIQYQFNSILRPHSLSFRPTASYL